MDKNLTAILFSYNRISNESNLEYILFYSVSTDKISRHNFYNQLFYYVILNIIKF